MNDSLVGFAIVAIPVGGFVALTLRYSGVNLAELVIILLAVAVVMSALVAAGRLILRRRDSDDDGRDAPAPQPAAAVAPQTIADGAVPDTTVDATVAATKPLTLVRLVSTTPPDAGRPRHARSRRLM